MRLGADLSRNHFHDSPTFSGTDTDPAPLEMFETTVRLKPKSEWRPGMTTEKLIEELDRTVRVPGLTNIWIPPTPSYRDDSQAYRNVINLQDPVRSNATYRHEAVHWHHIDPIPEI